MRRHDVSPAGVDLFRDGCIPEKTREQGVGGLEHGWMLREAECCGEENRARSRDPNWPVRDSLYRFVFLLNTTKCRLLGYIEGYEGDINPLKT